LLFEFFNDFALLEVLFVYVDSAVDFLFIPHRQPSLLHFQLPYFPLILSPALFSDLTDLRAQQLILYVQISIQFMAFLQLFPKHLEFNGDSFVFDAYHGLFVGAWERDVGSDAMLGF
jgi:hypothetical protein